MDIQTKSKHYKIEPLAEGVFASIAKEGGAAVSNSGVVDLGGSTLVIDALLTPTAAEDLRADAVRFTGRPPRYVIDTHYHNDHIWGSQAFLPEANIISTIETRRLIQTSGKEEYDHYHSVAEPRLKELLARQKGEHRPGEMVDFWIGVFRGLLQDFPRLFITLPDIVFENRLVLYGSRRRVELIEFTDAHTASDTVVYLPDDRILYLSDLLFVGHHGFLGDGNPAHWREVVLSILDGTAGITNVDYYVPGHGPMAKRADLQLMADYIQSCQDTARTLAEAGTVEPAQINSTTVPPTFASWLMPRFYYDNLNFLVEQYQLVTQGVDAQAVKPDSKSFRP